MDMKLGFAKWDEIERDAFGRLARMSTWLGPAGTRLYSHRILVPVDGSPASLRALHIALQMGDQHPEAELHLLNVQLHAGNDSLDDTLERQGLRETATARALLDKFGKGYCLHLTAGVPAEAIRAYTRTLRRLSNDSGHIALWLSHYEPLWSYASETMACYAE